MFPSDAGGMFGADQARLMEASFKEFLSRPENHHLVEKHQRREVKQAIQLQEKISALKFRDTVLESDYDAQIAIAPFLKNKVLRRIIQTFANDEHGDFGKWATNPRVLEMLKQFQTLIERGLLQEDEAEEYMLRILRDPSNEHHKEFESKTRQVARLTTEQLVEALNEHLTERRKGNAAYKSSQYPEALQYYIRARSIVDLVEGLTPTDQHEIKINKIAVNCNIAAVHLAQKNYRAAVDACDKALLLDPGCRKALIRRAKAHIGRHNIDIAKKEIESLRSCADMDEDILELERLLNKTVMNDKRRDEEAFKNIFTA